MAKDRLKAQSEEERLRQQIALLNLKSQVIDRKIDSVQSQHFIGKQLLSELAPLYPQIQSCSYSDAYIYQQSDTLSREKTGMFMITSKNTASEK